MTDDSLLSNYSSPATPNFPPISDSNLKDSKNRPPISTEDLLRSKKILTENTIKLKMAVPFSPDSTVPGEQLASIMQAQLDVVHAMWSSYSGEEYVTKALQAALDVYTEQLNAIRAWAAGGADMFEKALREMAGKIMGGPTDGMDLEDLFQILLTEILANNPNIDSALKEKIQRIMDAIGSGTHGSSEYIPYETAGGKIAKDIKEIFQQLGSSANTGLSKEIYDFFNSDSRLDRLCNHLNDHYVDDANANAAQNDQANFSPVVRLAILSLLLSQGALSKEELLAVLSGDRKSIDDIVQKHTDTDTDALNFLADNSDWHVENHGQTCLDFNGEGMDLAYFESLYNNFPARELTEDEMEQVNRIGDMVKMINESLKHWLRTIEEAKNAIARNT